MKLNLKNEQGFTLIETLLSLLISSFVLLLLTGGILQTAAIRDTIASNAQTSHRRDFITGDRQIEWHIFLNQLENYLQGTYDPQISNLEFYLKEKTSVDTGYRVVQYRRDPNRLNFSRRTDNGNQRMLTGIKDLQFDGDNGWLILEVQFDNGDQFRNRIWVESWAGHEELKEEGEIDDESKKEERIGEKTPESQTPESEIPKVEVTEEALMEESAVEEKDESE